MDISRLEGDLVSEIKLEPLQAKVYLLVNCSGKMSPDIMAEKLGISTKSALDVAQKLMDLGAFIDMPGNEFEAMHPRFTAVNMYRRYCIQHDIKFKQNKIVDNIGAALESAYDVARTGSQS